MPSIRLGIVVFVAALVAGHAAGARAALVLNEVLYDPAGDDTGAEFVEIWNDGDAAESLAAVALEAGDGARPGSWSVVFAGGLLDSVPPRGLFLVDGTRLTGALQNGPDALRLSRSGVVLDLLGWGALDAAEFFEGAPAADVASGSSLARRADGADSDRNADDWAAETPTPGAANHPPYRVTIASPRVSPEVPWPGDRVTCAFTARHAGSRRLEAGEWRVVLAERPRSAGAAWSERASVEGPRLAPGESVRVNVEWTAPSDLGAIDVRTVVRTRPDETPDAGRAADVARDSFTVAARVGAGPVVVNEIAFHDQGAGEWIELLALADAASWSDLSISDATGAPRRLRPATDASAPAPAARGGEIRVVAADPARFAAAFAWPESLLLTTEGGWASLNDSPSPGSPAAPATDIVRMLGADGAPCDAVPYDAAWSARGGSLERLSPRLPSAAGRSWSETIAPGGGTPGAANSVAAFADGRPARPGLLAAPRRVLRRAGADGSGALVLELGSGVADRSVRLAVLDLRGRVRRRLASGERFGAESAVVWDGRDDAGNPVEAGLYVVSLEASAAGSPSRRASVAVAVAARRGSR